MALPDALKAATMFPECSELERLPLQSGHMKWPRRALNDGVAMGLQRLRHRPSMPGVGGATDEAQTRRSRKYRIWQTYMY